MTSRAKIPPSAIYDKLRPSHQEIRLVNIEPSSFDPAVRVILRTVAHASVKGKYYCLSYAWGNCDDQMPIVINGTRCFVGCNLYSLLRRLRASKRNRNIWIDAICIDQADVGEKQSQVSIMHSIYSEAAEVLIGLDDSKPYSITDIETQHAVAAATLRGLSDDSHLWKLDYFVEQSWSDHSSHEISSSFGQVLNSKWFERTWVVQETCLAKKAILLFPWGDLDWERFHNAFLNWNKHSRSCCKTFADKLSDALSDACNRMYLHVRCIAQTRDGLAGEEQHITELMFNYQHLEVSDHRDKIYAFRGLHTDITLPLPMPDYDSSSMEPTFRDFLLWYLEDKQSLLILGYDMSFGNVPGLIDWPSWIPTWPTHPADRGIERGNSAKARGRFLQCYSAAPSLPMDFHWSPERPKHLQLHGFNLTDKISSIAEKAFTGRETFEERVELMKAWSGLSSLQDLPPEFCITMLAGIVDDPLIGAPRLINEDDDDDVAAVVVTEWRNSLVGMERHGAWYACTSTQKKLIHSQDVALLDRVLFRTEDGRMGVGPGDVGLGDEIYLLGGGNAPFLLRSVGEGEGSYRLVGHCYLYGAMNGEVDVGEGGGGWVDLV